MSAYDSVCHIKASTGIRVRVYCETVTLETLEFDQEMAVMVQFAGIDSRGNACWRDNVTMSPSDARKMAKGLLDAAERFEQGVKR